MKALLAVLISSIIAAYAGDEVVIYSSPEFTNHESEMRGSGAKGHEVTYVREFVVDRELLGKQPANESLDGKVSLSAALAIELARKQVAKEDGRGEPLVTRLSLLRQDGRPVSTTNLAGVVFYWIEMQLMGNSVERLVLMDGTVVKSRLRRVAGD